MTSIGHPGEESQLDLPSVNGVSFSTRDDGQVDAHLGPEWPIFNAALDDSISSLPHRGEACSGPSTYWIDLADHAAREARRTGDSRPFASGNITLLSVRDDTVVASYDYAEDGEPGEALHLDDFLSILARWRHLVEGSASTATNRIPETYRRKPFLAH